MNCLIPTRYLKKHYLCGKNILMKKIKISTSFSEKALKKIMNSQTEVKSFKGWQIIYSVKANPGKSSEEIAIMLGVSKSTVLRIIGLFNKYGKNWYIRCYSGKRGGRRQKRCHLSLEDEKLLMKSLEEEALSGNILTFRHIKRYVEERVGKEVSDDYIWDLFSRHGWKKKVPRQHHPKANKAAQEEYKKNSKKIWLPSR
jgi:transposase